MFIMLFANEGEEDPTIFGMVNNALCQRSTMSIGRVRNMLLGVIPTLRNLPRVDKDVLFIPVPKRFPRGSPAIVTGARLRCRSFVWAFTESEPACRSLQAGGTVFCVKGTSGKKVFGYDLGDLVFPLSKDKVLMNPDLCVSVQSVERASIFSRPRVDIVHVVIDDSVLPLLEDRFPTRTPKEQLEVAMALKAKKPSDREICNHVIHLLTQASARGSIEAKFQLGLCYADGFGVVKNTDRAVKDITAAANDKCVDAMIWLGFRCKDGTYGTDRHPKEALEWFKKAMSQAGIDSDTEREGRAKF